MHNMHGASERFYVGLPFGQVHGRRAGSPADPPIIFLHQSPVSSATFEAVLPLLATQGRYAIALDTPGFGMSDLVDPDWSMGDLGRALWDTVDALGLGTIDIVGQHTGATIAVEAHLQQPDRVRTLTLQGLPFYSDAERAEKKRTWAPGYTPVKDGSHLLKVWNRIFELYPSISLEHADRQVLEYLSIGPDYATAYRAVFNYDIDLEVLRRAPLRFLMGDGDLLNRMRATIEKEFSEAAYRVVPETTDFAALENPNAFVSLLLEGMSKDDA